MTSDRARIPDNQNDFRQAAAPITEVISDLVATATTIAEQGGQLPAGDSPAMRELELEQRRFAGKSTWLAPVQDTHTLGGVTLLASSDHLRGFAALLARDEAPTYAHLVLTRAAMQACVISAWLNEPLIDADERVKRGLVERLYSARQQQRIRALRPEGQALEAQLNTVATALRWTVTTGQSDVDPVVAGISRPDVASSISQHLVGEETRELAQVLWGNLSGVAHTAWYALAQAVIDAPREDASGIRPPLTGIGTESRSVNLQAICLIRLYLAAVDNRVALMGWDTGAWVAVRRRADLLHDSLLRGIGTISGG